MLWIAVHLPALALESFAATVPGAGTSQVRPIALLADQHIAAADARAAALGVRPGLKRATALALAPELLLGTADVRRDAQALRAVAHAALAFTPAVALGEGADAHAVLLEVHASLRLFGGLAHLLERLRAALVPLGHRVQTAVAPTAAGAALLARWAPAHVDRDLGPHGRDGAALQRLLDRAPLALLGCWPVHGPALQGMGLHVLADLRRLPRAGLARRFGAALLLELDRALGAAPDPRRWVELPPQFESRIELLVRADGSEQLLAGARMLLARLLAWAAARHARIGRFTLRMHHERRHRGDESIPPASALEIVLAQASADIAHLYGLLAERLVRLALPAPVLQISLHCDAPVFAPPPNAELFASAASRREGLTRLVERLQARLGREQVQRLVLHADHRPERAAQMLAVDAPQGDASGAVDMASPPLHADPRLPPARPLWLLAEPQALRDSPSGPLLAGCALQLLAGPERIETGWWDGALAARDYFIAGTADGALVWVFRQRLAHEQAQGWYLQGRFA